MVNWMVSSVGKATIAFQLLLINRYVWIANTGCSCGDSHNFTPLGLNNINIALKRSPVAFVETSV